jgi:predicted CXXCH cytochrome family protein
MKNHVLRPLWLAIGLVVLVLTARHFLVPKDFGVHGKTFTYGFYRQSNVEEWKEFPVKYQGRERCAKCHEENFESISASKHKIIQCENCHGPAAGHPRKVKKLEIDTSRGLCLRCHSKLDYPNSNRGMLKGVISEKHKRKVECSKCHNPHNPNLEDM